MPSSQPANPSPWVQAAREQGLEPALETLAGEGFFRPAACLEAVSALRAAVGPPPRPGDCPAPWPVVETSPGQEPPAGCLAWVRLESCHALERLRPGGAVALALEAPWPRELPPGWGGAARQGGVRLVCWRVGAGVTPEALAAFLRPLRRAGLWSHLVLGGDQLEPAAWCRDNPSLAHSWEGPEPPPRDPGMEPVPGRAFWAELGRPGWLLAQLVRRSVVELRRLWVEPEGEVRELGREVEYHFRPPQEIPARMLERIQAMIVAGGKVRPRWVGHNLRRAFLVAYALERGVLVGTETLKNPRPEYLAELKAKTGLDLRGYLERGYVSVHPLYRGLGVADRLVAGLVQRQGGRKVFLAIAHDSHAAQSLTTRHGSRPRAVYRSGILGKEVAIWIPEEDGA